MRSPDQGEQPFRSALRASLAFIAVGLAVLFIYRTWSVIQSLIVAIFLSTALWPWVSKICSVPLGPMRWRIPRFLATVLIFLATFSAAGLIAWIIVANLLRESQALFQAFPEQTKSLRDLLQSLGTGDTVGAIGSLVDDIMRQLTGLGAGAGGQQGAEEGPLLSVWALAVGLFGGLISVGLSMIFTFFLLLQGNRFASAVLMAFPRDQRPELRLLGERITDRMGNWTMATAAYGLVVGGIVGGAMWLLHVPSPWLYALGGLVLAVFPGLGPGLVTIPAFFVTLSLSVWQPIAVVAVGIALFVLDATVIGPKIYGRAMRIPTFIVLLAVVLGGATIGVWGALIAPLVAVATDAVLRHVLGRDP